MIQEVLRLYPPAWLMIREPYADDRIGGYLIPAGTSLLISPWVTHRRCDVWNDPLEFRPERFLGDRVRERHRFAWYPFGGGPRVCLGQGFAMAELKTVLALVSQRHRLEFVSDDPIPPSPRLTLEPGRDLIVR